MWPFRRKKKKEKPVRMMLQDSDVKSVGDYLHRTFVPVGLLKEISENYSVRFLPPADPSHKKRILVEGKNLELLVPWFSASGSYELSMFVEQWEARGRRQARDQQRAAAHKRVRAILDGKEAKQDGELSL